MIVQRFESASTTHVVIAALNEEQGIKATLSELSQNLFAQRVLVIDGNSKDRTAEIAKDCGADIIFQEGLGKGDAISQALNYVDSGVDYVVLTDADYTYPAEYVPGMIEVLKRNPNVGMVCGNRFDIESEAKAVRSSFLLGNKLLAFAHNVLNGVAMKDPLTGLRVVRAGILRNWVVKSKGFDIEVELNGEVDRQGFEIVEVPIRYRIRLGEKKLKMKDGATILKRILLESIR